MKYTYDENNGCYQNLLNQIHSIMKNTNEHSIKTRYRYEAATERFCKYLAEEYKLQKFDNVKSKHIISYVERLKSENKSASTIKTELAGIRFFHKHSNSKNILIDNNRLNLEQRDFAKIDRSWLHEEIKGALATAKEMGRIDIYNSINLAANFGLRLEETCKVTPNHLRQALNYGELYTKGKNGQERWIQIRNETQIEAIKELLIYAEKQALKPNDKIVCDNIKGGVQRQKRSIQNFITNNQYKFIDANRKNITDTSKVKADTLTFHGIRYLYCNELYNDIYAETKDKSYSKKYCSEQLGHHREHITTVYLK